MTHSKDLLAEALFKAGLDAMAEKAKIGWYHDFMSPLAAPALALDQDLVAAIRDGNLEATTLRGRHHNGEFDATEEEGKAWEQSPEGQAAFQALIHDIRK